MTSSGNDVSGATRALADLAFASQTRVADASRPLAWLSPDELAIDLDDPAQRRFGDYELVAKIGQGGMGVVYRAHQHGLERDVALKLLAAGPWASEEFIARFRREAKSAARMQHPNIVEIYEFGERAGLNWFSMRLIDGESLAERLQRDGVMSPRDAARMLRTVAEAIDYAHRLGVLHLDLKPANVLLTRTGEPMVADFGLARRIDAGHDGSGEISGTPSYMAPEQALLESHPLSASTDIYGLGATLYRMITGRPPFTGGDAQTTLLRVASHDPERPRRIRGGIPADMEAICLQCLEKDPANRYASAHDLAVDLGRFLEGRPVSVRPLSAPQRLLRWARREPRLAMATAATFAALAVGVVATGREWRRAEAALVIAETQRQVAETQALRVSQSLALMADLFPTNQEELKALDNPHIAAASVMSWLDTKLPDDENAQVEILSGFLTSLVDGKKNSAADSLVYHISTRLGADYYRAMIASLLARGDEPGAMAAALVAFRLEPVGTLFEDTIRAAVASHPESADVLYVAALLCEDDDDPTPTLSSVTSWDTCAVPDAADRLVSIEPDNAANWILHTQSGPMRTAIANAAGASRYDDRFGRMLLLARDAPALSGVRIPDALAELSRIAHPELEPEVGMGYLRAWDTPIPSFRGLRESCDPRANPPLTANERDQCLALGRTLVESRSGAIGNLIGSVMLMRLGRGTALWDEMIAYRRRYTWSNQALEGRTEEEAETSLLVPTYWKDVADVGEVEAGLRRLERLGLPRTPPPDWQPSHPENLLPEEDRAAYLADHPPPESTDSTR